MTQLLFVYTSFKVMSLHRESISAYCCLRDSLFEKWFLPLPACCHHSRVCRGLTSLISPMQVCAVLCDLSTHSRVVLWKALQPFCDKLQNTKNKLLSQKGKQTLQSPSLERVSDILAQASFVCVTNTTRRFGVLCKKKNLYIS